MYEELILRLRNAAGGPEGIKMAHDAADAITALQSENAEKDKEIERLKDEPLAYKFYYCESEDSYLLGRRLDTLYYARWHKSGFVWEMSRFLPWGQTIEAKDTAWKKHTYPSEPVEISPDEWFAGFLQQRFSRLEAERYALVALINKSVLKPIQECKYYKKCYQKAADEIHMMQCPACDHWEWRGAQEE